MDCKNTKSELFPEDMDIVEAKPDEPYIMSDGKKIPIVVKDGKWFWPAVPLFADDLADYLDGKNGD